MAKRIDILFGSRIDESGAKKDIERIKTIFKASDLKIVPQVDNSMLKEFQKNLKVTIDEATKLKTLTSSFTQGGVKYNVSQRESSRGQWSKPSVTVDYLTSVETLEKKLKSLYRTAIETQENINSAARTGALTYQKNWEKSLKSVEEDISKTQASLAALGVNTGEDRTVQRLTGKFGNLKLEQDAIEQKKAMEQLEAAIINLTDAETKLEKAQAYHSSGDTIDASKQQVALWKQQVQEISNAANASEELKQRAQIGLEESSTTSKAVGSVAAEKQGIKDLEEYSRVLKQLTKLKIEQAQADKQVRDGTLKADDATEEYIKSLKEEVNYLTQRLNILEQSMSGTEALNTATQKREQAEKEVATAIARSNAQSKEQLSLTQRLTKSFKGMVDNFLG